MAGAPQKSKLEFFCGLSSARVIAVRFSAQQEPKWQQDILLLCLEPWFSSTRDNFQGCRERQTEDMINLFSVSWTIGNPNGYKQCGPGVRRRFDRSLCSIHSNHDFETTYRYCLKRTDFDTSLDSRQQCPCARIVYSSTRLWPFSLPVVRKTVEAVNVSMTSRQNRHVALNSNIL